MKMLLPGLVLSLAAALCGPALAALKTGDKAPDFTAPAMLGGKDFTFHLADALKKGPVVVYFYPAAFTSGCTVEAHDFAEAMPQYQALGATVIGVSHDDMATLGKFSVSECQSKFPVASDARQSVMKAYDAVLRTRPEYANRISYLIAPDGKVTFHYMSLNPAKHVERMLEALRAMPVKR